MYCSMCRRELADASDVLEVQEGIVGLRGIVPLTAPLVFCSENCLRAYFEGKAKERPKHRRKIP